MRRTRAEIFIVTGLLVGGMNFYLNSTFFFFNRVHKIAYSLRKFAYFKLTETCPHGVFHSEF